MMTHASYSKNFANFILFIGNISFVCNRPDMANVYLWRLIVSLIPFQAPHPQEPRLRGQLQSEAPRAEGRPRTREGKGVRGPRPRPGQLHTAGICERCCTKNGLISCASSSSSHTFLWEHLCVFNEQLCWAWREIRNRDAIATEEFFIREKSRI